MGGAEGRMRVAYNQQRCDSLMGPGQHDARGIKRCVQRVPRSHREIARVREAAAIKPTGRLE